jgi:hypothetical protein
VKLLDAVVTDDELANIRRCIRAMHPSDLELHEAHTFGRFVVHNHVNFAELHHRLTPIVSLAAAEEVEPSYNFLCLYGSMGACPPHLDAPNAKWTLDLCIDQGAAWPIHISHVNSWPDSASELVTGPDWEHELKYSPQLRFTSYAMKPGQALVFSGSSQWHYREPIPAEEPCQFCDLLFFHFIPKGTAELVQPENWTRLFGVPELSREVSGEDR